MNPFLPGNSVPQSEGDNMTKTAHLIVSDAASDAVLQSARRCTYTRCKQFARILGITERVGQRFSKPLATSASAMLMRLHLANDGCAPYPHAIALIIDATRVFCHQRGAAA
ncbi:MAG TPA: hypothetical protein VK832_03095 [Burkholderiaceae bacterium]|nr:hypothetical protein [Burkholderiaceae bacterium]